MLSQEFVSLIISSTKSALQEVSVLEDIEKEYKKSGGSYAGLENPRNFDNYSYLFFRAIAMHGRGKGSK